MTGVGCSEVHFFFQAEDGIRDVAVTGVQTCALPIFRALDRPIGPGGASARGMEYTGGARARAAAARPGARRVRGAGGPPPSSPHLEVAPRPARGAAPPRQRSPTSVGGPGQSRAGRAHLAAPP